MGRATKTRRKRLGKKACITLPTFGGDHGTETDLANEGTLLVPVVNEVGKNPNRMARRQRADAYRRISLTMRQEQAAKAIRDAYCRVEMLSSGSPLKERVQASAKPDATIDIQCAAQSKLVYIMMAVPRSSRRVVEHVLWQNKPLRALNNMPRSGVRFRYALELVADHLCY